MSENFPGGSVSARLRKQLRGPARRGPSNLGPSTGALRPQDLGALADMCHAIGDEDRLRLFKRIAQAGHDGVEAFELDDEDGINALIAAGVVKPMVVADCLRYRAERSRLVAALTRLGLP